jgi:hypothetical protein
MKKYTLLIAISLVPILAVFLAGFLLIPSSYEHLLNIPALSNQPVASPDLLAALVSQGDDVGIQSPSEEAIRLQLPETYLQKQLDLILVAAPFGSEVRDYEPIPEQVCLHSFTTPALVSPAPSPVELILSWKWALGKSHNPVYDSYVISLWHPSTTTGNYVLMPNQAEFLEALPDPSAACNDQAGESQIEG